MNPKPKQERIVNTAWVLDVDGVIANLKNKKANPKILQYIYQQLINNIPLALNTGRSLDDVIKKVLNPLTKNHSKKNFFKNLFVVGEKGATYMTFDDNGESQKHVDVSISISPSLKKDIRDVIAAKYSKSMFYDTTKKTMISTEIKDGYDMSKYEKDQKLLAPEVEKIIKKYRLEKVLIIELNPIALDIQHKYVGKHLGIKYILNWLRKKKINVSNFTTIGDMPSDIKMAEELHRNNFSVTHVYVGEKKIEDQYPFKVITTSGKYEKGAEEYLNGL